MTQSHDKGVTYEDPKVCHIFQLSLFCCMHVLFIADIGVNEEVIIVTVTYSLYIILGTFLEHYV